MSIRRYQLQEILLGKRAGMAYRPLSFGMDRLGQVIYCPRSARRARFQRPVDMTVTIHIYRGNFRKHGSLQAVTDPANGDPFQQHQGRRLFPRIRCDRDWNFSPLQGLKDQQVVLGLISSRQWQRQAVHY